MGEENIEKTVFNAMFDCFENGNGFDDIPCISIKLCGSEKEALNEASRLKGYCSENNRTLYFYVVEPALVWLTIKDGEKIGEQVMREYVNTIIRFKDMGEHWADNSKGDNE